MLRCGPLLSRDGNSVIGDNVSVHLFTFISCYLSFFIILLELYGNVNNQAQQQQWAAKGALVCCLVAHTSKILLRRNKLCHRGSLFWLHVLYGSIGAWFWFFIIAPLVGLSGDDRRVPQPLSHVSAADDFSMVVLQLLLASLLVGVAGAFGVYLSLCLIRLSLFCCAPASVFSCSRFESSKRQTSSNSKQGSQTSSDAKSAPIVGAGVPARGTINTVNEWGTL